MTLFWFIYGTACGTLLTWLWPDRPDPRIELLEAQVTMLRLHKRLPDAPLGVLHFLEGDRLCVRGSAGGDALFRVLTTCSLERVQ